MRVFAVLCAVALATPALAKPPLRDVAEIDNTVMVVAIADELRKTCSDIDARMIRALGTLNALKSRARSLGYSEAEIEDYVTSKSEKTRMRAKGEAYLKANGVKLGDTASTCAFGRSEIARNTPIGRLLRQR